MNDIQIGDLRIRRLSQATVELQGPTRDARITIPMAELPSVIEFLSFCAESDAIERRRSHRLTIEPEDALNAWITTSSANFIEVKPLDLSLGGMLARIDDPEVFDQFSRGTGCLVRIDLDGNKAELNSEVVRAVGDQLGLSFLDCEREGELVPTVDIMRIYSELQRRWLSRRVAGT